MCAHVSALIHSFTCVADVYASFSLCVRLRASSSHIPLGWSQCFWRRPRCLDYWVCQDCEGNKRGKRKKSEQSWLFELHSHKKNNAPLQRWILEAISSFGSLRNRFMCLWHIYRCTPPSRTPSCKPWGHLLEASVWFRFSNQRWSSSDPEGLSLGGLITRELRGGCRSWNLYLLCVLVCVVICSTGLHVSL